MNFFQKLLIFLQRLKYRKFALEQLLALELFFLNVLFTHFITFSDELLAIRISNISKAALYLKFPTLFNLVIDSLEFSQIQFSYMCALFYFSTFSVIYLYFIISLSDPGHVPNKQEKFFINQRFYRLEQELNLEKEENSQNTKTRRNCMFKDPVDSCIYKNYFDPNTFINFNMKDERKFKFC